MSRIRIHTSATAETLAAARILVALLWLARLVPDPVHRLGHLPSEIWFARGVLEFVPGALMATLLEPAGLSVLRFVAIGLAVLVGLGVRPHRASLASLTLVLVVYLGIGRGFGAHVNHRELVLLYVTGLLVFLPCFDALALQSRRRITDGNEVYRASMIALCLVIVTSYVYVGVARLAMGFPTVYDPDVMRGWLVSRSLRPGPLDLELGAAFLGQPASRYLVPLMLPVSTILELASPLALSLRERPRLFLLIALAGMHVGIALLMNIVFIESVVLLVLFVSYTPWVERIRGMRRIRRPAPAGTPPAG